MYKLVARHNELIEYGFAYRDHYKNYIFMLQQPETTRVYEELKGLGYNHDKASNLDALKRTYMSYCVSVDPRTHEVSIWTHALNNHPYERLNHQHNIPCEFVDLLHDLIVKNIIKRVDAQNE